MAPIMNDMTVPATPTAPTMPTAPTASVEPAGTTPALNCRQAPDTRRTPNTHQAPNTGDPNPAPPSLDFDAVVRTHDALSAVLPETPAWSYPLLTMAAGVDVVVKHENVQPTGAFKVRGGVALMATLSEEERSRGVVTASTGNHAQSLAWAGARRGAPVTVVVPTSAPARKISAVRALGARVIVEGETMCDSLAHAGRLAAAEGMRLVSPGDEPAIILGHATVYLELFRRHRDLGTVYVPVGSGSGAAGACLVRTGEPTSHPSRTRVAGLAVGASFALTQSILRRSLDDFILVGDDEILRAVGLMSTHAHTLAEGAGAASLAGLMADSARGSAPGGPCAVICTGGNADDGELAGLAGQAGQAGAASLTEAA